MTVTSPQVTAEDLGEVYCKDKNIEKKAKQATLYVFSQSDDGKRQSASALWAIAKLEKALGIEADIRNVGETEFVMSLTFQKKKDRMKIGKIIGVAAVTFVGSIFAIMTYNEDVSVLQVFEKISEAAGQGSGGVRILACGYAAGIAAGIILFFNHFGKKKLTRDPTPMEVEMDKYEQDVDDTLIKKESRDGSSFEHS